MADSRTDEDQLGATYDELEWAMSEHGRLTCLLGDTFEEKLKTAQRMSGLAAFDLSDPRKQEVLLIYNQRHVANKHKMNMPPVCIVER
jgi:NAD+ synthase